MDFENLKKTWESFGTEDPLWSILSWEGKQGNNWDEDEFFTVGEGEAVYILGEATKRKPLLKRERCLDFGCGVGRLTLPLSDFFSESHGVDISAPMIALADRFKQDRERGNCSFHINTRNDLELFEDDFFDFVLSLIVLQHMEPRYFVRYIEEFVRILAKDGVLVFQLPDKTENRAGYEAFEEGTRPVMEMYGMEKESVIGILENAGATVLDVVQDESCGPDLKSYRYFVTKQEPIS